MPPFREVVVLRDVQELSYDEIAGYGTVATYAEILGRQEDHDLPGQTLAEEKKADETLKRIAKESVDLEAARP